MRYGSRMVNVHRASPSDLQAWLERHNWANAEGASKLGISQRTIYNWLDGKEPRDLQERMNAVDAGEKPQKARALPLRWIIVGDANKSEGQKVRWTAERCEQARQEWAARGWSRADDEYWGKLVEE